MARRKPKTLKFAMSHIIQLWTNQDGKCIYCRRSMKLRDKYLTPTIEHIIPKCDGGSDNIENLNIACFKCNQWRGQMPQSLFLEWYRYWNEHSGDDTTLSTHKARKVRGPRRWYHGDLIRW